jgi:N6-adenosine-specific RNA methylase IME4/DNA-binding CsgD family transcriptional regulator
MSDKEFERLWAEQIKNAKGYFDYGVSRRLLDPSKVRLTIAERQKQAKALVEAGLSKVEAAELLGVDETTVRRDLRQDTDKSRQNADADPETKEEKTIAKLREQIDVLQRPIAATTKRYGTIIIDPPWPMQKIERDVRPNQVTPLDYPTMDYDALRAFRTKIADMVADDCHVFMWTTQKFLPMALRLFEDYGVKYVLTMVWHKPGGFQPVGLPQYNCEFVIYGRIGSPIFIDTTQFNCCFGGVRKEHSRKPDEFYALIKRVTLDGRIDVFSREQRAGFDSYGNEVSRFNEAAE